MHRFRYAGAGGGGTVGRSSHAVDPRTVSIRDRLVLECFYRALTHAVLQAARGTHRASPSPCRHEVPPWTWSGDAVRAPRDDVLGAVQ
ncbi:hypothetical protein STAFG_9030 [Streptomyces afghaniensis 772]|uniref:Uncharacterized protein n=1 Tax=Streptomyces afghaniensis 772 TaxID=1283301 RepID=S4MKD8_9ACTN|nr:hypothetical protein STAFG_9030 [Streptomyces afghaniensis 772]